MDKQTVLLSCRDLLFKITNLIFPLKLSNTQFEKIKLECKTSTLKIL